MPTTGEVVLLGIHSLLKGPPLLVIYGSLGSRTSNVTGNPPCNHNNRWLLGLETDGQDFLLIACRKCKDLKLLKLRRSTATTVDVYSFGQKNFSCFCRGEPGVVYVSYGSFVHEYKYSSSGFSKSYSVIGTGEFGFSNMCCSTTGQRALVGCTGRYNSVGRPERTIRAVSVHNNEVLWEFSEEINGTKLGVTNVLYVAKDDVILVDDADNNRFVVLNSHHGSFLRTIRCLAHMQMPQQITKVRNIDINKDKLSVLYSTSREPYTLTYFVAVFTFQLNP